MASFIHFGLSRSAHPEKRSHSRASRNGELAARAGARAYLLSADRTGALKDWMAAWLDRGHEKKHAESLESRKRWNDSLKLNMERLPTVLEAQLAALRGHEGNSRQGAEYTLNVAGTGA